MAPPAPSSRKRVNVKEEAKTDEREFFQLSPLPLSIFIIFLLILYWFVCYNVDALPLQALGPLGKMLAYLESNYLKALRLGFRFTIMVHLLEAGFAYRVCRRMMFSHLTSFKWLVQTLVVGFPSLGTLLRYRKERELRKNKSE
ncbi:unnamed protein product [Porites evermanni]|uniref:Transmembrane protein 254 n=1 Tax=Porites evermanni TaxID=104178 RepID=A0ABN8MKM1_9CNID|nr:unnamed protein product [Porites evermanni]